MYSLNVFQLNHVVQFKPFRRRIGILWLLLLLIWIGSSHALEELPDSACPSSCKCSHVDESPSFSDNAETARSVPPRSAPIMARCWIPANMVHLPCTRAWTIVHLQILTGQPQPNQLTASIAAQLAGRQDYPNISVSPKLFDQCASLTRLAIWERSQFTWLPQYWLRPLIKLERLFIQVPTLHTLPDHFFAFLPRLNFVKISKCSQLARINRAVFEPCPETLHTLWLDGNGLRGKLPAGVFRQCNFRALYLSENQLNQLDWGSLSGLKHLQTLHLQRNRLTGSLEHSLSYRQDMNSTALGSTPMLKKLDLSFNQLTSIEGKLWSGECLLPSSINSESRGLCFLEELELSHNQLKWLALDSFSGLPRLRKLNMDANPELFTPEGSANLALVLYALSEINKHFQNLIIPVRYNQPNQPQSHFNGSINLCHPDELWLQHAPRYLSMLVRHVNQFSCNSSPLPEWKLSAHAAGTTPISHMTTENVVQFSNQTNMMPQGVTSQNEDSDPILAFVRTTNRFNLLMLCLGLIFLGLLIGLLPMTYLACKTKPRNLKNSSSSTNTQMPLFVYPGSDVGLLLTESTQVTNTNSPNGSLSTPLPKRSGNTVRNGALPPIPPTRFQLVPQRVPLLHGSADPIRARPLIQPAVIKPHLVEPVQPPVDRARRVHSIGNVYHRTRPQSASSQTRHRYDRLVPQDSPNPMEMNSLAPKKRTPAPDTVYCRTEDTAVSGSEYSLATLTSFRGRSPTKGGTIVPTAQPAAV